jgi:DNA-binding response OmpR family regulator
MQEHSIRCTAIVLTDGEVALKFLDRIDVYEEPCPSLVILDLNLPRRSGAEVLKRIRDSLRCNRVPVLILTSSENQRDREEVARLGASRYVVKPFHLDEFVQLGSLFRQLLQGAPN